MSAKGGQFVVRLSSAPVRSADRSLDRTMSKDKAPKLTTFQVPGAPSERQRIEAVARFGHMLMEALWDVFAAKHLRFFEDT
jgi:hypothetical protein